MSVQAVLPERGTSPLASNNPFRTRIGSGDTNTIFEKPPTKSVSTNPFLDSSELSTQSQKGPVTNGRSSPSKPTMSENTTEVFSNMSLNNKPLSPDRGSRPSTSGAPRRDNFPPRLYGRFPPTNHRPNTSDEDRKRQQNKPKGPGELDIFADPPERAYTRDRPPQRRNSETSVRDPNQPLDPEEEKRRRERKHRDAKRSTKAKPTSRKIDVIDKLDVTSIYGTGLFHHDGPFDACNPHRNRKSSKHAPMQAFPKDSNNMRIGGSGPVNPNINLEQFHGIGQEAHIDYNEAAVVEEEPEYLRRTERTLTGYNPTARQPLHGHETVGLGTSTFLEGAPASRAAIQRRESENEAAQIINGGNLSRKKSLAQKLGVRPRITSPDFDAPLATSKSESNADPFFKDYDQEYEKKGAQIAFAEEPKPTRARAPSSPRRGLTLEKQITNESIGGGEESKSSGGLLSRVKSLKVNRRARPERRETSS